MTRPDIVITGMGLISPIGLGPEAFWDALMAGRSAARPVSTFDTSGLARHVGCQVDSLPAVPPEWDARTYGAGRCTALALAAAEQALTNAGLTADDLHGRRVAVLVGTTMGEFEYIESVYDDRPGAVPPPGAFDDASRNLPGRLSKLVARGMGCPDAYAIDVYGACAAGNMALIQAMLMLRSKRCDLVLAGGADAFSRFAFVGFMRNRVMAKEQCRPYDRDRDGLLVGEGSAIYVVERVADAIGRQRHAGLVGGGTSCDAFNPTQPRPDGSGITSAVRAAERDGGITTNQINYVCSHGTGTPRNDLTEWEALDQLFPAGTPFSSIKALTGHTMGAAGAIEAGACMLAMRHGRLIPNWHLENPAADFATRPVRTADAATLSCTANLSFGFGGYNSCLFLSPGDT